ncbi:hypothetical protein NLJ89_g10402 [Agrocybe chaxingu]|uniref:Uncharacterized protein n=1 Tax=Agrocybe chaxingu TaxID=84603 RepID=A0A9W8JYS4_9AGAR|nr:hypothetical protein NLJ89_g10402 [Agrocybe chaxingu]
MRFLTVFVAFTSIFFGVASGLYVPKGWKLTSGGLSQVSAHSKNALSHPVIASAAPAPRELDEFDELTIRDLAFEVLDLYLRSDDFDLLEERAPTKGKVAEPKIRFHADVKKKFNALDLHGKDRLKVKKFHRKVVKDEMKKNGAARAVITHEYHSTGSRDPTPHITVKFYEKSGKVIPSKYGTSGATGQSHHLYGTGRTVPTEYTNAITAKGGRL